MGAWCSCVVRICAGGLSVCWLVSLGRGDAGRQAGRGGVVSEDFPLLAGFRAGSLVAGYQLEAQVGAGGMAVVFRARDERLGRLVALKILSPALAADAVFRQRFIAESRAAAAVDNPHIVPVFEAGESGGVLFIAMRFVAGGDLRGVLAREGPLPPARAAGFLSPVASALDAAHRAGLVHRDVKPANILVDAGADRPDHVYLSDFGLSKGAVSSVSVAGAGHFLGTPDYSAPEQVQGRAVDGRTDQYALACVAFQLLAGSVPFERDQGMAVLLAHLSEPPPPLASRRPGLPGAADLVLARAMAKVPEKRYGSCREFADALRDALGLPPYTFPGLAWMPGHPPTEPGAPRVGFSAPAPVVAAAAAGVADPAAALTVDSAPGSGPARSAEVPPAASGATGHRQDPPAIPADTSPTITSPRPFRAVEPEAVAVQPGTARPERQCIARESAEVSPGIRSGEPSAGAAADAAPAPVGVPAVPAGAAPVPVAVLPEPGPDEALSAPHAGLKVGLVNDQLAFPPELAATKPEPVTPAYGAAGSGVVADGLTEDLMTYARLAQQGTTDAQAAGPDVSDADLPLLTPGIRRPGAGPATDSGMVPDAGAAVLAGSAGQNRSLIAGLRHGLGARPLVLAAAAVLVVAVGIGSWLGTGTGPSHGTGTAHRGVAAATSQTAQALAGPVKVRSSPSITVSSSHPAPTPSAHRTTRPTALPTPASSAPATAQTSPAPRPAITYATSYPVSISGATEYSCSSNIPAHYSTGGTVQFTFTNNSSTTMTIWWVIAGDGGSLAEWILHPYGGTIVTGLTVGDYFAVSSLGVPVWPKGCLVQFRIEHSGEAIIS